MSTDISDFREAEGDLYGVTGTSDDSPSLLDRIDDAAGTVTDPLNLLGGNTGDTSASQDLRALQDFFIVTEERSEDQFVFTGPLRTLGDAVMDYGQAGHQEDTVDLPGPSIFDLGNTDEYVPDGMELPNGLVPAVLLLVALVVLGLFVQLFAPVIEALGN